MLTYCRGPGSSVGKAVLNHKLVRVLLT